HACGRESFDHVVLDAPGHRADEPIRRRRRVRGADLQDLGHQRRIAWDPVPHDDPAAGPRYPNDLLCHVERLRGEHRSEDADDEIEAVIGDIAQVGRIAFLESAVRETKALRSCVTRLDEVVAISTPRTFAPSLAAGKADVPSPQPRSRTSSPGVIPQVMTSAPTLSRTPA